MANTMRKNTDVGARGGASRSSVEAFVMKVDSAYASQNALIHSKAPRARDFTNQRTRRAGGEVDEVQRGKNRNKSKIRARVEHVFAVVKRLCVGIYQGSLSRAGKER